MEYYDSHLTNIDKLDNQIEIGTLTKENETLISYICYVIGFPSKEFIEKYKIDERLIPIKNPYFCKRKRDNYEKNIKYNPYNNIIKALLEVEHTKRPNYYDYKELL